MTQNEYLEAREFIKGKALELMKSEKKGWVRLGVPIQNLRLHKIDNRTFYSFGNNIFLGVIEDVLLKALEEYPQCFGTGDAKKVIIALLKTRPLFGRPNLDAAINTFSNETNCYIIENHNGETPKRILRIDLFRLIQQNKTNAQINDFVGGIFHALKHFSINGKNLSTGTEINDISHPKEIIELATRAFFIEEGKFINDKKYISYIEIGEKKFMKFVFHRNNDADVFFIDTIHITKNKKF